MSNKITAALTVNGQRHSVTAHDDTPHAAAGTDARASSGNG